MNKIMPCLWFDHQAEEAARFYVSIFKDSKITDVSHYGQSGSEAARRPAGSVMTVVFQIEGQNFMALNGGPIFKFSEAISLVVSCKDQAELDAVWSKLTADGGSEGPCGWCKDKYGLSWQLVPSNIAEMMADKDPARSERVMAAVLGMRKLDLKSIQSAYEGQ